MPITIVIGIRFVNFVSLFFVIYIFLYEKDCGVQITKRNPIERRHTRVHSLVNKIQRDRIG